MLPLTTDDCYFPCLGSLPALRTWQMANSQNPLLLFTRSSGKQEWPRHEQSRRCTLCMMKSGITSSNYWTLNPLQNILYPIYFPAFSRLVSDHHIISRAGLFRQSATTKFDINSNPCGVPLIYLMSAWCFGHPLQSFPSFDQPRHEILSLVDLLGVWSDQPRTRAVHWSVISISKKIKLAAPANTIFDKLKPKHLFSASWTELMSDVSSKQTSTVTLIYWKSTLCSFT